MSASPLLSYFSNSITSFPYNRTKSSIPFISSASSKFNFISLSLSSTNGSNGAEIDGGSIEYGNEDSRMQSSESILHSRSKIKAPTAPWMNEPLLVEPYEMESMKPRPKKDLNFGRKGEHPDMTLTGKVGGARGRLAMKKIYKGIENLRETKNFEDTSKKTENRKFKFAPGALWGDGHCESGVEINENREATEGSLESDEFDIPLSKVEKEVKFKKLPWERDEKMVTRRRVKKEKVATAAESSLHGLLLERLKNEAALIRKWVKVMKAGVTQAVVDQVHFIWRNNELALLKIDIPLCRNMDRARDIVEMKTGGLVVWRNKEFLAVYRGCNYVSGSRGFDNIHHNPASGHGNSSPLNYRNDITVARVSAVGTNPDEMIHGKDGKWESLQLPSLYERESDRLLDGLGPRFVDWWMQKPLPVDGDLLPERVPGFKTPFRLSPPCTRSKLTDADLTYLRKLARPLPTHFVLVLDNSVSRQGLPPPEVAKVVSEREMVLTGCQLYEEAARLKASENFSITEEHLLNSGVTGTLSEFHSIDSEIGNPNKGKTEVDVELEAEKERLEKELKDQERRLLLLKRKIEKSAKVLEELRNATNLSEKDHDLEIISEEERVCLREIGLRTGSSLVLGRRGVYDGVIEGMHQHWKHREVIKVITLQKRFSQVMHTARCVEAESGGILVDIVKLKEGHAIIVYRGKNYKRAKSPALNLLNKREALSRSLEIQRRGSLKFFAEQREQAICDLKRKLAELSEKKNNCRC